MLTLNFIYYKSIFYYFVAFTESGTVFCEQIKNNSFDVSANVNYTHAIPYPNHENHKNGYTLNNSHDLAGKNNLIILTCVKN